MARFIQDKDGRFAGSVGDRKSDVPTAADYPAGAALAEVAPTVDYDAMLAVTRQAASPQAQSLALGSLSKPARLVALKHGLSPRQAQDLLAATVASTPQASAAENRPLNPSVAARLVASLLPTDGDDDAVVNAHESEITAVTAAYRSGTRMLSEWEAAVLVAVDQQAVDAVTRTHVVPAIPALGSGDPAGYVEMPESRRCTLCGQFMSLRSGHSAADCYTALQSSSGERTSPLSDALQDMRTVQARTIFGKEKGFVILGEPGTPQAYTYVEHTRHAFERYSDDTTSDLWTSGDTAVRRHLIGMLVARDGTRAWRPGPGLRTAMMTWPDADALPAVLARLDPPPSETEVGYLISRIGQKPYYYTAAAAKMLGVLLYEPRTRAAASDYLADYPISATLLASVRERRDLVTIPADVVERMAASGDPQVRATAAVLPQASIDAIERLVADPDPEVREAVAQAGGNTRRLAGANIDALVPLVNDDNPHLYQHVFRSLINPASGRGGLHGQHVYLASRMRPDRLADAQAWVKKEYVDADVLTRSAGGNAACVRILALTA